MKPLPLFLLLFLAGCAQSYTVPGGPARLETLGVTQTRRAALADPSIRTVLDKKPLARFPAVLAVARVQSADYALPLCGSHPSGRRLNAYSVLTTRDIEKEEDFEPLGHLPQVVAVATMKRILLNGDFNNDADLRQAAARLHADLLLFYTFDTTFYTDTAVRPLGVITLGLFPNKNAKVATTASAVLMDVNNGYIYAIVESTAADNQLANAWSSADAVDQVRRRTERRAFEDLLAQFKKEWTNVVIQYAPRPAAP